MSIVLGPVVLGILLAALIFNLSKETKTMSWWNPWAEAAYLRAKLSHEEIDNANLRAGNTQLRETLHTYRSVNEDLQRRIYLTQCENRVLLDKFKHAHRRDPKTGRILKAGE